MKAEIIMLLIIGFSNLALSQIKSEKQVTYWLDKNADERGFHKNTSRDSCVIFWEEYNQNGKITKKYDFPSDRCWQMNGPWEHHYFYDDYNRLIEHRNFGGEEGKQRILMRNFFYSYPYLNEPFKANEFYFIYNYKAKSKIEEQQIDTFYLDTVNTKGMHDYSETRWKFDTIKFDEGYFIFREDFKRNKKLFHPDLIIKLIGKENIKDFEISLLEEINQISHKLTKIYETDENYFCRFEYLEIKNQRSLSFEVSKSLLEIEYKFLNQFGDCYLSFQYESKRNGYNLKKLRKVKSYIKYYN